MIYLSKQKILFLKPRKVAGTSFEIALSRFAGPEDIITPITKDDEKTRMEKGFPGPRKYKETLSNIIRSKKKIKNSICNLKREIQFYNHIPAKLARERLGEKRFDDAYKISIVRNPYDTLISLYFWETKNSDSAPSFTEWIRMRPGILNINSEIYFINGRSVIDFHIRYEKADQGILEIERNHPELSGLSEEFSSLSAKGGIRPKGYAAADMFENEDNLVRAIQFFSKDMINKFGYKLKE